MAPSRPPRPPTRPTRDPKELLKKRGADLIRKVSDKDRYAIFLEPVDASVVPGYADVIERPMDLSTAQKNLQMGVYRTPMELRADLDLIWSNCCTFNADDSIYYKEAVRLRALAARYYDDFVRVLVRDGVASALGLNNSRQSAPSSSRLLGKRPPRHRQGSTHSAAAQSSSLLTSEPTSPDGEVEGSASASASGSASGPQYPTYRESQIRRARAASDAAATAAAEAAEEARLAAIAAGVPPNTSPDNVEIFAGPNGILAPRKEGADTSDVARLHALNHRELRDRCSRVGSAWRRVGRWHTRGATSTRFNTRERGREVRYGRMYERHIAKSAPAARRLLAIVLDAGVVEQHDSDMALRRSGTGQVNGVRNGVGVGEGKVQNGRCRFSVGKKEEDEMDVEYECSNESGKKRVSSEKVAKRPRTKEVTGDGENGRIERTGCDGSISKLKGLLQEHNIDSSFLGGLGGNDETSGKGREVDRLLGVNHWTMMNVLRLRALGECGDETEREYLEDLEREYAEQLTKGMCLAVAKVRPKFVVEGVDAAEGAAVLCESIRRESEGEANKS